MRHSLLLGSCLEAAAKAEHKPRARPRSTPWGRPIGVCHALEPLTQISQCTSSERRACSGSARSTTRRHNRGYRGRVYRPRLWVCDVVFPPSQCGGCARRRRQSHRRRPARAQGPSRRLTRRQHPSPPSPSGDHGVRLYAVRRRLLVPALRVGQRAPNLGVLSLYVKARGA